MLMFKRLSSRVTALAVGFALVLIVIAGNIWFNVSQQQGSELVQHTMEVESQLYRLLSFLEDAETGQRGYLLTGDEGFLAPYLSATAALDGQLNNLAALVADPGQRQALSTLTNLVKERLARLKEIIDRYRVGERDQALAMVRSGASKVAMDQARASIAEMVADEAHLLEFRQRDVERMTRWLFAGMVLVIILVIALALIAIANERRRTLGLGSSRNALALANEKLVQEAVQRGFLEQQLRQSQKLEAIGQLTGGIAHDFNNMLAIVIGSLNILKRRLSRGEGDTERFIDSAMEGAERATVLTHRLLAFSRQQPLAPEPVEVNKFVTGMSELLRRTLGENIHLETVLAGGLWRTHTDASQLENALLNLAVNARDAMPDSGHLTIETANAYLDDKYATAHSDVPAGQYVMVAVSDSGSGMSPGVLARALDPFFTTKAVGKGTGLGLSQVYGFVKQSGGHVRIYSESGQGTSVKLYLPRFLGAGDPVAKPELSYPVPTGSAEQVVLVVENEERVRQLTAAMLSELGYTVLDADGPASALRVLDANPEVQLLFTDIVMPDMNGRQLAEEAQRRSASLKVLYTTGYTRDAIVYNGVLDADVRLISKPFTLEQLANKVKEVFDSSRK
jgi:signal transduction histidine kinase/CheY-like chemotaxis protein